MGCKVDILICMCGLPIDVELEVAVFFSLNEDIEHGETAILFAL